VNHGDWAYLTRTSDRLKEQADAEIGDWRQRPATVRQLLAAGLLAPEAVAAMTVDELAAECKQCTRAEVSDMLGAKT
jgi:hypothetical protein